MATNTKITDVSQLDIALYRFSKWGLVAFVTVAYYLCYSWNLFFAVPMIFLFAYCFSGLAAMLVHFVVWCFTKPALLEEKEDIVKNGIPSNIKIVFFRPIFAKTNSEMDTLLDSMRLDIINNQEPHRNLKFILIDNTRDDGVKTYVRGRIEGFQKEFGKDVVFYFHRNVKCDFFKKVGIYEDSIMLLYEGWTRPRHYIDKKWEKWTKGTRNPENPLFDVIMGDVSALGIDGTTDDIIKGREIKIREKERISVSIVCDADNVWPELSIRKLVAKMVHPANKHITIFQPSIEISNPNDNRFIRMTAWGREMYGFDLIAKWRVFRFTPFFGKGAMNVGNYVRDIIKSECLHPGKAASHDFQEALRAWCVLLEDVYILEKTFSNKLSELTRGALWMWGDMETVEQYLRDEFEIGRKTHLFILLRNLIGTLCFSLWALGTLFAWLVPTLAVMVRPKFLFLLFALIVIVSLVVPKFIAFYLRTRKERGYSMGEAPRSIKEVVSIGLYETLASTLIHTLDLVYRPIAFLQNFIKQSTGIEFVWKTGAMGEMETANRTLIQAYQALLPSTIIGAVLFLLMVLGCLPWYAVLFCLPFAASFLIGPAFIWFYAKPLKQG